MKTLTLAVAVSAAVLASPAFAQLAPPITVSFTEAANDDSNNPAATVTNAVGGYTSTSDGERSRVTITNYFGETETRSDATTSDGTTSVFNLMEGAGQRAAISDQITFSRSGNNLLIDFISDPARFLTGEDVSVLGSAVETGSSQTIFDSSQFPNFPGRALRVTAASETETGPVPEPATWAMMLLGFGGIGMAMRARRRKNELTQFAHAV